MKKQLCLWKNVRRKESSTWRINKDFYFKKYKESDNFKEIYKKNGVSKLVKVLGRYPKLEVIMNLKGFNDVEIC